MSEISTRHRGAHSDGRVRQRGEKTWELRLDLGLVADPKTGRLKRQVRYATAHGTKKDALRVLAQMRGERDQGTLLEPGKMTVAEHLEGWVAGMASRVSRKTLERYSEIVRKHLSPAIGAHLLTKLSPIHIRDYYASALRAPRKRTKRNGVVDELAPLSAHTIKHHHRILSQALKQAFRLRLIARNPAADVDPPRPLHREMKIIDQAQTGVLLKALRARPSTCRWCSPSPPGCAAAKPWRCAGAISISRRGPSRSLRRSRRPRQAWRSRRRRPSTAAAPSRCRSSPRRC
jgi:hypothetical protein